MKKMPGYLFCRLSIHDGKEIGNLTIGAVDEDDAMKQALHRAKQEHKDAILGKTKGVLYPRGLMGGETWVLLRKVGR